MTDFIERALRRLCGQFAGHVSMPGDDGYVKATAIWAKPAGPAPHAVVHCNKAEHIQWAIRTAAGQPERLMKSYGRNAERLIRAKRHYDPENIFRSAIPLPVDEAMADVALAPSGSPEDNAAVGIRLS